MSAPRNRIITGDAVAVIQTIAAGSIDMVLMSPPYFRLRDYGVDGQLGLEADVDAWADQLTTVATAVERILVSTGSLWINLGDSYSVRRSQGAEQGSLLLAPERLALRLTAAGWRLRNKIVWRKTNPLPSSVRNRLNATYEVVHVFVRSSGYFFDLDAVRLPHLSSVRSSNTVSTSSNSKAVSWNSTNSASRGGLRALKARGMVGHPLGKNPGDVWSLAAARGHGGHHAAFPVSLAERAIAAGTPERRCSVCWRPFRRAVIRAVGGTAVRGALHAECDCHAGYEPGLVLDPFMGTGTTAVAAERLGRDWLGIELNPDFVALAETRIAVARAGPAAA